METLDRILPDGGVVTGTGGGSTWFAPTKLIFTNHSFQVQEFITVVWCATIINRNTFNNSSLKIVQFNTPLENFFSNCLGNNV